MRILLAEDDQTIADHTRARLEISIALVPAMSER